MTLSIIYRQGTIMKTNIISGIGLAIAIAMSVSAPAQAAKVSIKMCNVGQIIWSVPLSSQPGHAQHLAEQCTLGSSQGYFSIQGNYAICRCSPASNTSYLL